MAPMKSKCPVCGKKVINVAAHIRKMAMGEIYTRYLSGDIEGDFKSVAPHQSYIESHSVPQFTYGKSA